ncbi:MAG: PilZ domain-containing protein [Proteobacteria bacterium]|nr:PilZ domain-containing protein [Pseudomonadota bacterium]MBU1737477.1 PilZ domain-containing protein [Pseudomonadota bacterium]
MADNKSNIIMIGWVQDELGYQKTRSRRIIEYSLQRLKETRRFISLIRKDYQSGNTVLVDFDSEKLIIDLPVDWPAKISGKIVVNFRDESNLMNHYAVQILARTKDSIITSFPVELFKLQRRNHFRVELPSGVMVSMTHRGENKSGFAAKDISGSGIMIFRKRVQVFDVGDKLQNICIREGKEKSGSPPGDENCLKVKDAEVVRIAFAEELNLHYAGIMFFPDKKEEEALLKYVRQLELAHLRK